MQGFVGLFAYLGPETMLPLTSVAAGVAGVLLMLGRTSIRWILGLVRGLTYRVLATLRSLTKFRRRKVATIQDLASTRISKVSSLMAD